MCIYRQKQKRTNVFLTLAGAVTGVPRVKCQESGSQINPVVIHPTGYQTVELVISTTL